MKVTRRDLLVWSAGAAAGLMVTPVPWKLLDDTSIWSQNWPWIPQSARGPVEVKQTFCTLCPNGCGMRVRMAGTLLSFFHQGSLGGLYGVLRGRPFAFRTGFFIWPSTFFLFILSAIASGPSFLMLVTATVERVTGRRLVPAEVLRRLGFISGVLLGIYVAAKSIDTLVWLNITSPSVGFAPWQYYIHKPFGTPILFAEIVLFGLLPAFLLTFRRTAMRRGWLLSAAALACGGVLLNRFVLTVQTLAVPTLPFDEFLQYTPSWQEIASFAGVIAYGVIIYSLSYRYLPLFAPLKGEDTHVSRD
jgi:Ni/Fe-hydrogenase subunit HybB-like protein